MRIIDFDSRNYQEKGNLFTSRNWIDLLKTEYKFTFKILVDDDVDRPILLFSEISDIFGERIVSLPFSDYMEPVLPSTDKVPEVMEFLRDTYKDRSITIRLHGQIHDSENIGYKNIRSAFCHRVPLNGAIDDLWGKTTRAFRKGVKKAISSDLMVRQVNSEAGIDMFYRLLAKLRRNKFHLLPQTKSFYMGMLNRFVNKDEGNIWVVLLHEVPVASAIVLHSGNALFDKMGVSDEDYLHLRPNNLLLSEIMTYGNAMGYEYLDMGLTQSDYTGLLSFKDSLGGIRTPINFYKYTPENHDARREKEIKDLLSSLTKILVDADMNEDAVQQAAGLLYKYFC